MFSQPTPTPLINPQAVFDEICAAARTYDKAKLKNIIKEYATLDIQLNNVTPGQLLAREGHNSAVWFLYNNFNVDLEKIINGAASGDHEQLLQEFIGLGLIDPNLSDWSVQYNQEEHLSKNYARGHHFEIMRQALLQGGIVTLASKGDFTVVDELILKKKTEILKASPNATEDQVLHQMRFILQDVVLGAALGGFNEKMEKYIKDLDRYSTTIADALYQAMLKAAKVGNTVRMAEIMKRYVKHGVIMTRDTIDIDVVQAAAAGGHLGIVLGYIDNPKQQTVDTIISSAISGAIAGGHYWIVKHFERIYPKIVSDALYTYSFGQSSRSCIATVELMNQMTHGGTVNDLLIPRFILDMVFPYYQRTRIMGINALFGPTRNLIKENYALSKESDTYHINKEQIRMNIFRIAKNQRIVLMIDDDNFRHTLVKRSLRYKMFNYECFDDGESRKIEAEMALLLNNAFDSIKCVMTTFDLNTEQASLMLNYVAIVWLFQGRQQLVALNQSLTEDAFYEITRHLVPQLFGVNLDHAELKQVGTAMSQMRNKNRLFNNSVPRVEEETRKRQSENEQIKKKLRR